jgi:hypothetical protein
VHNAHGKRDLNYRKTAIKMSLLLSPYLNILKINGLEWIINFIQLPVEAPLGIVINSIAIPKLARYSLLENDFAILMHQHHICPSIGSMICLDYRLKELLNMLPFIFLTFSPILFKMLIFITIHHVL